MAGKKSKKFVIATEGATVDGRTIDRSWIEQMAANYSPATYKAGINVEHIRSVVPDSPFKNYGHVESLSTQENGEGKLQLLAEITPSDDLIKLVKGYQKTFTSIEVNPKFAGTGKAYLQGLAVTDTPASLGTDMLAFTASNPAGSPLTAKKQHPDNHFSVATETVIDFDGDEAKPGLLERLQAMFNRKDTVDAKRFSTVEQAIEEVAQHGQAQSEQTARKLQKVDGDLQSAATNLTALTDRVKTLEEQFQATPAATTQRPAAAGHGEVLTEF